MKNKTMLIVSDVTLSGSALFFLYLFFLIASTGKVLAIPSGTITLWIALPIVLIALGICRMGICRISRYFLVDYLAGILLISIGLAALATPILTLMGGHTSAIAVEENEVILYGEIALLSGIYAFAIRNLTIDIKRGG